MPSAYFFTFTCYGTHLHGDPRGSVDDRHHWRNSPYLGRNEKLQTWEQRQLRWPPYELHNTARKCVRTALVAGCERRGWELLALHIRTTHVHVVLRAKGDPKRILAALKAYATKALNESTGSRREYWTEHGSAEYLWKPSQVEAAVHYVALEQGTPLELFVAHPDETDSPRQAHGAW
jgi:REP element-mobilizing transposase RayT